MRQLLCALLVQALQRAVTDIKGVHSSFLPDVL
jgi:hypothetical protein